LCENCKGDANDNEEGQQVQTATWPDDIKKMHVFLFDGKGLIKTTTT